MRRALAFAATLGVALGIAAPAFSQTTTIFEESSTYYPTVEFGVYAGVPTGLSAKYWLSPFSGIDGALSWRFPNDGYSFNVDYIAHSWAMRDILDQPHARVPLYAGAGIKALHLSHRPEWGARFPIGVNALLDAVPISIFAEIAPGVIFKREAPEFNADAGIGARVYF